MVNKSNSPRKASTVEMSGVASSRTRMEAVRAAMVLLRQMPMSVRLTSSTATWNKVAQERTFRPDGPGGARGSSRYTSVAQRLRYRTSLILAGVSARSAASTSMS